MQRVTYNTLPNIQKKTNIIKYNKTKSSKNMKSYQVSMYSSIHSYSEPKIVHALAKALIERGIPFNFDGDTVEFSMSETMKSRLDKDGDKDLSIIDWQKAEVK